MRFHHVDEKSPGCTFPGCCWEDHYHERHLHGQQQLEPDVGEIEEVVVEEEHPRDWSQGTKLYNVTFIVLYEAFAAVMATAGSSAADQARSEFLWMTDTTGYFVFTTVSLIGELFASFVLAQVSESWGRKNTYVSASLLLCLSLLVTTIPSLPLIMVGRFLTGFAGNAPEIVSPGSLEEIYASERRVWSMCAWSTAAQVGLVIGPIVSSYMGTSFGWRWIYWFASAFALGLFCMSLGTKESRPRLRLSRRGVFHGQGDCDEELWPSELGKKVSWESTWTAVSRPTTFLLTEPIIMICSVLNSIAFALIYSLTESLPMIYSEFGFTGASSSLAFLPILVGVLLTLLNRIYEQKMLGHLIDRSSMPEDFPEMKIKTAALSAPALAIGLLGFTFTIPPLMKSHWLLSMIFLIPIGYAANDFDTLLSGYLTDAYTSQASSAFAALSMTRSFASIIFSWVTVPMYDNLGYNNATAILAAVAMVFAVTPNILIRYGYQLRKKSPLAASMSKIQEPHCVKVNVNRVSVEGQ